VCVQCLLTNRHRYLFALQIKRDLASGHFVCNDATAALLVSYVIQAECGDYSYEDYPDHTYLSSARLVPNQTSDFERAVMENHKKLMYVNEFLLCGCTRAFVPGGVAHAIILQSHDSGRGRFAFIGNGQTL